MRTTLATISLLLATTFYGLLVIWFAALARVGGIASVPQQLHILGREAAVYGVGLTVLGTVFLLGGVLLGRGKSSNSSPQQG